MRLLELHDYYHPVLAVLATQWPAGLDGEVLIEQVADMVVLPATERIAFRVGSPKYVDRVKTARANLGDRGYVTRLPDRRWAITEEGLSLLKDFDARWTVPPEGAPTEAPPITLAALGNLPTGAPIARVDRVLSEIHSQAEADLADRLLRCSPSFFERLVLQLLSAMGYGAFEHTGKSGDGGIDGILFADPLRLDVVCVQAKLRKRGQAISVKDVREFDSAVAQQGRARGVFVTNARFSKAAEKGARWRVRLIGGEELTALMVEHGVGVSRREVRVIPEVDRFFFDE